MPWSQLKWHSSPASGLAHIQKTRTRTYMHTHTRTANSPDSKQVATAQSATLLMQVSHSFYISVYTVCAVCIWTVVTWADATCDQLECTCKNFPERCLCAHDVKQQSRQHAALTRPSRTWSMWHFVTLLLVTLSATFDTSFCNGAISLIPPTVFSCLVLLWLQFSHWRSIKYNLLWTSLQSCAQPQCFPTSNQCYRLKHPSILVLISFAK